MKAHCGIGGTAPLILKLCSGQNGMVSFAHQSVYLTEITCSSHQTGGGVSPRARLGALELQTYLLLLAGNWFVQPKA